jgi:hypothetical protein
MLVSEEACCEVDVVSSRWGKEYVKKQELTVFWEVENDRKVMRNNESELVQRLTVEFNKIRHIFH